VPEIFAPERHGQRLCTHVCTRAHTHGGGGGRRRRLFVFNELNDTVECVATTYYSVYHGAHVRARAMVSRGCEGVGRSKDKEESQSGESQGRAGVGRGEQGEGGGARERGHTRSRVLGGW
jgi:hypothetical protein